MDKFKKAKGLVEGEKIKFLGLMGSSLYFEVASNEKHQVIFRIINKKWLCDCRYSALYEKDCSHILACKHWLQKQETLKGQ